MAKRKAGIFDRAKSLLFPKRCAFCRKILPLKEPQTICPECMNKISFALSYHRCSRCGRPAPEPEKLCHRCTAEKKPAYSRISAPYLYRKEVRGAILRFKGERYRHYAHLFAEHMEAVFCYDCNDRNFDWVISVPPRRKRMRQSGYDQAAFLGKVVAKKLQIPYLPFALSQKEVRAKQSSLSRGERFYNMRGNIKVKKPKKVLGNRILLVDDVCTTGATLKEAAMMLKEAGATEVYCLVAAIVE